MSTHAFRDNKSFRDPNLFVRRPKYPRHRRHVLCSTPNSSCAFCCAPSTPSASWMDDHVDSPFRCRSSCLHWDNCCTRPLSCRCCSRMSAYCCWSWCSRFVWARLACQRCFVSRVTRHRIDHAVPIYHVVFDCSTGSGKGEKNERSLKFVVEKEL